VIWPGGTFTIVTQLALKPPKSKLLKPIREIAARKGGPDGAKAEKLIGDLEGEAVKEKPDDGAIAKIVDGIFGHIPEGVKALVSAFASPILGAIAGPVTKFVLDKLRG
jgi:hypothetical protein